MAKRLMAFFLAVFMLFCTYSVVLAEEEKNEETKEYTIVTNGDFEKKEGWGLPKEATYVEGENAYEGEGAVKIESTGDAFFTQSIYLVGGETYELSLMAKSDTGALAAVKFEYYSRYAFAGDFEQRWSIGKKWTECKVKFEVPEIVASATMLVRLWGGGNLYFDNIKIEGKISDLLIQSKDQSAAVVDPFNPEASMIKPAIGDENLFENGDMETLGEDGFPVKVDAHGGGWNQDKVTLETEEVYSGKYAAKISTQDGGSPWIRLQAYDLMGGGTYQVSFWYKGTIGTPGAAFNIKLEGYTDSSMRSDNSVIQTDLIRYYTSENWKQVVYTFTIPDNCKMVALYPRCYPASGTLYVDDVKFYLVGMPSFFEIDTDQVFYYSDVKAGTGTVKIKDLAEDIGYKVNVSILDGDKVLMQSKDNEFGEDKKVSLMFPVDLMKDKLKEYTFRAEILNPDGTVADTIEQDIYKCDRPSMLTKEGNFIVDGKPFYPAVLYHSTDPKTFKMAVEEGINVVQTAIRATPEAVIELLDAYQAEGMKVALMLYESNKAAGDPARIDFTKQIVAAVKNHPALFCWMTMDEPNAHYNNRAELYDILTAGYKAIREIDPVHPIYHCEASTDLYDMGLKFTDSMGIDPYPGSFFPFETHVADVTAQAEEISNRYGKGIIQILEVFTFGQAAPTEVQLHSMMYQSVMAGADANGYYPWKMDNPEVDGATLDVSKWWPVIQAFKDYEYDIVWRHYGKHYDTQVFNEIRTDDYWIDIWVDGADVYTAVLNRKAEEQKISVPMTSGNGLVKIPGYSVAPVNGDATITKTEAGFDVDMPAGAALLFKVTPESAVNISRLNEFGDLAGYDWAADAVNQMYGAEVVNDKGAYTFAPGENITRGDFVKFLIRALGLYEYETFRGNFDDVTPDAEYAVEVAIGKQLGILKGVGDNCFNPEAPITRQDLMVICARGMNVVRILDKADLSVLDSFTDVATVADYAKESISVMAQSGIVKGNDDGSINPLGNTTRAEAAVIMQRISDWNCQ